MTDFVRAGLPLAFACLSAAGHADWLSKVDSLIVETPDQVVLALPETSTRFATVTPYGDIALEVEQGATHQTHRVTMSGRVFELKVPESGPSRHLAFDPKRRAFTRLLPSLRIELTESTDISPVVEALQATGVTRFDPIGIAFVDLPEELHPLDALAIVDRLEADYSATVRLPSPPIVWH